MAEIGFYHLNRSTLVQALPQLLVRTLGAGQRALILAPDQASLDGLSVALWAQPAWLPHGSAADGDPGLQPIWLSTDPEPLNGARYLFMIEGVWTERLGNFDRVFDLFNGNNADAVAAARIRWKAGRDAGHALAYWQQTEGSWRKQA